MVTLWLVLIHKVTCVSSVIVSLEDQRERVLSLVQFGTARVERQAVALLVLLCGL